MSEPKPDEVQIATAARMVACHSDPGLVDAVARLIAANADHMKLAEALGADQVRLEDENEWLRRYIFTLRECVQRDAEVFREYEGMHRDKAADLGKFAETAWPASEEFKKRIAKADANATHAKRCDEALNPLVLGRS